MAFLLGILGVANGKSETPRPLFKNSRPRLNRFRKIRARDSVQKKTKPETLIVQNSEPERFVTHNRLKLSSLTQLRHQPSVSIRKKYPLEPRVLETGFHVGLHNQYLVVTDSYK